MPCDPRPYVDAGLPPVSADIVPVPQRLTVLSPSSPPPPPPPPPPRLPQIQEQSMQQQQQQLHQPLQQQQQQQQQQSHPIKCPAVKVDDVIPVSVSLSEDFLTGATSIHTHTVTPMAEHTEPTTGTSSSEEKAETPEEEKENDKDILTEVSIVQQLIDEALLASNWGSA